MNQHSVDPFTADVRFRHLRYSKKIRQPVSTVAFFPPVKLHLHQDSLGTWFDWARMQRSVTPSFGLAPFHSALYSRGPNRLNKVTQLQQLLVRGGNAWNDHSARKRKSLLIDWTQNWNHWVVRLRSSVPHRCSLVHRDPQFSSRPAFAS